MALLGPVYTNRQLQYSDNSVMTLGLQPHSGAPPLFSMRTESLASLQSCHSIDADAWCKPVLRFQQYILVDFSVQCQNVIDEKSNSLLNRPR